MPTLYWRSIAASAPPPRTKKNAPPEPPRQILRASAGYACSGTGPEGGLVAVMGASGSGKSTLLSFLAGRAEPDDGTRTLKLAVFAARLEAPSDYYKLCCASACAPKSRVESE